ncbi:MAG: PAS domain S-box protein, partial [Anaerolineales bacterium]|nr:PAS domain S-box protein [Anaerolineales bacterium]
MKPFRLVALVTNNDTVIGNTAVAFSHLPENYTLKTCRTLDHGRDLKQGAEPDLVLFDWAMLPELVGIHPTALAQFEQIIWLIPPQTDPLELPTTHPHLTYDQLDARHLRPILPPLPEPVPSYDILRQIFDEIPHPILLWRQTDDQHFVLEQANRAADGLGRGAMAQYLGNTAVEFFRGNQAILKRLQTTFETGQHQQISNHFRVETTQEVKWLVAHYVKINATHLLYLLQDITNERQAVLDVAYSEAHLRSIWDYVSDALVLSDAHGRVIDANQAYFDLYGYTREEIVDRDFAIIFPEEQRAVARAQYQQTFRAPHPPQALESMIELATGEQRFVETTIAFITNEVGERLALLSSIRDISKRKQAQQALLEVQGRLVQSEKLATIGELLASVAHELNNPVTTLVLNAELLQQYNHPADNPVFDRLLTTIISQAQRSSKIVHNLLDFARQRPPERTETQLNELVLATIELLVYELRTRNVRLETVLSPDLPQVVVDAQQIQQVLVNLLNNAIQALEGRMPKLIAISTQFVHGRVQIAITDNGPGIPLDQQQQIFNSFFTTKEPGL